MGFIIIFSWLMGQPPQIVVPSSYYHSLSLSLTPLTI